MDALNDDMVQSVQLNPAILDNVRRRVYDSLEGVMIDSLYVFFSKMFLKAVDDSALNPEELNPLNVFIDRLDLIPKWGEEIVHATTTALREHAEKKFKFFDLKKYLKRILSTQLCQAAALENKACSSRIQLNDVHIDEFLFNILKLSAPHVSNAPQLFTPRRGVEYVKREEGLDLFLGRSIRRALSQFVELFLWRIAEGEVDSPFVAIPKAIHGDVDEQIPFKELKSSSGLEHHMDSMTDPDPFDSSTSPVDTDTTIKSVPDHPTRPVDHTDNVTDHTTEHMGDMHQPNSMQFDDDPSNDKPWSIDEGPRGRFNDDDDLQDDERRNPRRLSFNEKVEVQDFERDAPVSILKNNKPSRIYKTKFDGE